MPLLTDAGETVSGHPLDLAEQFVVANQWPYDRRNDEELAVAVEGHWNRYQLWFVWREDLNVLQFSCAFDMKVMERRMAEACTLLAQINTQLWFGHFDISGEDGVVAFRNALLLGDDRRVSRGQIEDMVEIALAESERFFPAFMFLLWGGKSPTDALASAMLETVGEA